MGIRERRAVLALCAVSAVSVALSSGTAVHAHEIGTTRVSVRFHEDRTYDIEVVTDATALVEKVEASTGGSSRSDTSPHHLQSSLTGFDETFRRRVKIAFDGSDVKGNQVKE